MQKPGRTTLSVFSMEILTFDWPRKEQLKRTRLLGVSVFLLHCDMLVSILIRSNYRSLSTFECLEFGTFLILWTMMLSYIDLDMYWHGAAHGLGQVKSASRNFHFEL